MNDTKHSRLRYPGTSTVPQVGDHVRFLDDPDTLIVEDVIDTPESRERWGLDESGIMLKGGRYGLVFDQLDVSSEVEFIALNKDLV